ncbi:unnamed protein product [Spirodela intermedia]|uniref:Uncharacterized protein n=2 Tax=Spirodela intermedia TaxID=51605 RepID=A0A7I8KD52_SPIIN|nr:unnamed protein product [Spirodela intermedia]
MGLEEERAKLERAADELERRSRYLSDLIQQQRRSRGDGRAGEGKERMAAGEEVLVVVKEQGPTEEKQRKRIVDGGRAGSVDPKEQQHPSNIRVRAADMPLELQRRAFRCARQVLGSMPKLDSKRLALTLKKEFDSTYGPAWHCIVGTSFGSYVTHSLGGFLYFSVDKVHILLFRTAVEPLEK